MGTLGPWSTGHSDQILLTMLAPSCTVTSVGHTHVTHALACPSSIYTTSKELPLASLPLSLKKENYEGLGSRLTAN